MTNGLSDQLAGQLTAVLQPILGDDVAVANLHLLTGGASRMTYSFDAVSRVGRRALILRAAPLEGEEHFAGMELEAAAQSAAAQAGAPVPDVLVASDSPAQLGNPFLICGAIAGETIVRRIQRQLDDDGRAGLLTQCAEALAAIHRARAEAPGLAEQDPLAEWRQRIDDMGDTTATFEWAYRWLQTHRPATTPNRLVHGDFRMGNLIVNGLGSSSAPAGPTLAAVLDWELVHIGDLHEDLAWFCLRAWRFGAPAALDAGGLGSIDEFVGAYERASGVTVDRSALHWWMVLGTLRWGMICRYQAERHLSGQTRSVELAAIGRRVCETEWDLLDLLVGTTPPPGSEAEDLRDIPVSNSENNTGNHGRPTAAELVAAVAEFLEGEVRATTAGAVNFHALVAANALRIVERELLNDTPQLTQKALAAVGCADEEQLASAIKIGKFDVREEQVLTCLRTLVGHRLAIAHPGYSSN